MLTNASFIRYLINCLFIVTATASSASNLIPSSNAGQLSPLNPSAVSTVYYPDQITLTPDGRFAYVTSRASKVVSQFSVGTDGQLHPLNPSSVPA